MRLLVFSGQPDVAAAGTLVALGLDLLDAPSVLQIGIQLRQLRDLVIPCHLTDNDELGYLSFEIDKKRFSYRITAPYTEERRALARAKMNEINNKEDIG